MARILTTNANFFPGSIKDAVLDRERSVLHWDMDRLNGVMTAIGADGIELH